MKELLFECFEVKMIWLEIFESVKHIWNEEDFIWVILLYYDLFWGVEDLIKGIWKCKVHLRGKNIFWMI